MRLPWAKIFRFRNIATTLVIIIFVMYIRLLHYKIRNILPDGNNLDIPLMEKVHGEKKDWHDYEKIKADALREGIGEQGIGHKMPLNISAYSSELYAQNGYHAYLSDQMSLTRSLPDLRHPKCKDKKYLANLPTVSVVVPFFNEHNSTLLRTAMSVLIRSPRELLKEVILVDDGSTKSILGAALDEYISKHMPKVRVLRLPKRNGLISARLAGAKEAVGDVLVFLDAHCEATVNWLPPLLEPIAENYRTAVCPYIDVIAADTYEYRPQDDGRRGAFDWEFFYKRLPITKEDKKNMPEPFKSPVMAGGLFAISKKWFWELGGYDPGLQIWGGEQYELSFKIWQCGGKLLDAPCSRVGHIYRLLAPFPNPQRGDFVGKNYRRVAEVWMDEYAQYLYKRRPHYLAIDPGDLTEQRAVRERLQCKPFKWFMKKIAYDLPKHYPMEEPERIAHGRVRPIKDRKMCLDAKVAGDELGMAPCVEKSRKQEFVFTWRKEVLSVIREKCWDLPDSATSKPIRFFSCHKGGGNQLWMIRPPTKQIYQGGSGRCVDFDPDTRKVFINACDPSSETQRWELDNFSLHWMEKAYITTTTQRSSADLDDTFL